MHHELKKMRPLRKKPYAMPECAHNMTKEANQTEVHEHHLERNCRDLQEPAMVGLARWPRLGLDRSQVAQKDSDHLCGTADHNA